LEFENGAGVVDIKRLRERYKEEGKEERRNQSEGDK
jgi:hypothetical protein